LKGGDNIFENLLNKLSDIVVLKKIDEFNIISTKYDIKTAKNIINLFFVENGSKILEKNEIGLEFEYEDKIFNVVVIDNDDTTKLFSFQEISKLKEFEFYKNSLELINNLQKNYLKKIFNGTFNKKDWKGILEKFVKSIPNVNSSSLILKDKEGYFRYVSVYNHNIRGLKNLKLKKSDFLPERFKDVYVIKIDEILEQFHFSTQRRKEITDILVKYGNLARIKSMISIPIFKDKECIGFLT
jgi:hypothetical protein